MGMDDFDGHHRSPRASKEDITSGLEREERPWETPAPAHPA